MAALLPIGVFLVIFLGAGVIFRDFNAMPAIVAFLIALFAAFLQNRKVSFDEKVKTEVPQETEENPIINYQYNITDIDIESLKDVLDVNTYNLYVYSQTNLENIVNQIDILKPDILVIDSIQSIYTSNITSSSGSVSQIRECTNILMDIAKNKNITVIVIGHVTKDGNIAGPKILEHMVDTVIYFEGDKYKSQRLLRSIKNRFGSTNEIGVFNMVENGLEEVKNPSELFMKERNENATPGSVIIATLEGTRALLVEVQALVGTTSYPSPRRVSTGVEYNRLLQIIAVLEKRIGLNLSKHDVYVNVIGGIEIDEPAADLGIALAVATCYRDVVVDSDCVIIGEISLSGEIRNVSNIEKRIYEAQKLGFKKAIIPKLTKKLPDNFDIQIIQVPRLMDAISACVSKK